jgi:hypothetical protein
MGWPTSTDGADLAQVQEHGGIVFGGVVDGRRAVVGVGVPVTGDRDPRRRGGMCCRAR